MRGRLGQRPSRARELADALDVVGDRLIAGSSLRQAIVVAVEGGDAEPLRPVAHGLSQGRPIVAAFRDVAADASGDRDLAAACCVLAIHANLGGDPTPACRSLSNRLLRREAAKAEARAMTTQTRLGARAILVLTPAFLLLVALTDPKGPLHAMFDPRARTAVLLGLMLQCAGAMWISAIVGGVAATSSPLSRVPVLRAARAIVAGRGSATDDESWAEGAELFAFALDAGSSPSAALASIAPFADGEFGDALREVMSDDLLVLSQIADGLAATNGDAAKRFARAVSWSAELGVPLAPAMRALATDLADADRLRLATDVRRASIRVLLPLGLLILPAFVLACLVPLFVGGIGSITGS